MEPGCLKCGYRKCTCYINQFDAQRRWNWHTCRLCTFASETSRELENHMDLIHFEEDREPVDTKNMPKEPRTQPYEYEPLWLDYTGREWTGELGGGKSEETKKLAKLEHQAQELEKALSPLGQAPGTVPSGYLVNAAILDEATTKRIEKYAPRFSQEEFEKSYNQTTLVDLIKRHQQREALPWPTGLKIHLHEKRGEICVYLQCRVCHQVRSEFNYSKQQLQTRKLLQMFKDPTYYPVCNSERCKRKAEQKWKAELDEQRPKKKRRL